MRTYAMSKLGLPYQLGEEFDHDVGPVLTTREDGDCSGLVYAAYTESKVLINGKPLSRETADTYWHKASAITQPSRVGDMGFLVKNGAAYHTFLYVGKDLVVEAGDHGPGGGFGQGYVGTATVVQETARGARWGRFIGNDIGDLASTPPAETIEAWMDRTIFKPRDSELSGAVITQMQKDYGLKPLWVLTVTGAETSCGRKADGPIVTQAHNYGCITYGSLVTKWGLLATPNDPLVLDGRRFFKFPNVYTGATALGRLLKVGPTSSPGLYLKQLQVRDWHGFALTYYGKDVPGVAAYEANLLKIEAGFKQQANAAGWQW
jgi:cell wall-associated NlpC family hydrolase